GRTPRAGSRARTRCCWTRPSACSTQTTHAAASRLFWTPGPARRSSWVAEMKHTELLDENCAIARSSAVLGERWVWVILRQAFNGARRFEDFQRGIGLARNVLTERLNWLVDHGIFERRPYAEHATRELNEYRLT